MSTKPSEVIASIDNGMKLYADEWHGVSRVEETRTLATAVQAVIALHRPDKCIPPHCYECSGPHGADECAYPCPTRQALTDAGIDVEVGS